MTPSVLQLDELEDELEEVTEGGLRARMNRLRLGYNSVNSSSSHSFTYNRVIAYGY